MTKSEKGIILRLTILGIFIAVLLLCMMMNMGATPEGIRVSTIDIGETFAAYMK